MLQEASSVCKDPSVLRRLTFAASNLHQDTPKYWNIVTTFGFKFSEVHCTAEKVKVFLENINFLDENASDSDQFLLKELIEFEGFNGHPLGLVLISSKKICDICGKHLLLREDRPSFPIVYTDDGTISGTHFRKYCSNHWQGCSFTQHYGFHQRGNTSEIHYDDDCLDLPYFLSMNMTAVQTKMLKSLSAEILLGQLSYKQKSDIYNFIHGYDIAVKMGPISSVNSEEYRYDGPIHRFSNWPSKASLTLVKEKLGACTYVGPYPYAYMRGINKNLFYNLMTIFNWYRCIVTF